MSTESEKLLRLIEDQLDWGSSGDWQGRDFEKLSGLIFEKTHISLSPSTLKRVWGRVNYNNLPSSSTMDALAVFAGQESWRAFCGKNKDSPVPALVKRKWHLKARLPVLAGFSLLLICLCGILVFRHSFNRPKAPSYRFSNRKLSQSIPNSVVFDYDASGAPSDSVYIQQSWDPAHRALVGKNTHQHTSVYYEPGNFKAKLVVNHRIVKENTILIPTSGWVGLIENKPVPVYLDTSTFLTDRQIHLPLAVIRSNNILLSPQPPVVKFFNVGNFVPVSLRNLSFRCEVRNDYRAGAGVCGFAAVELMTSEYPINMLLGIKGCSSELNLISVDRVISGKTSDLSGFGTDMGKWISVAVRSDGRTITYFVNGKLAYTAPCPRFPVNVIGMSYAFLGTGSVRNIRLSEGNKAVFEAFK